MLVFFFFAIVSGYFCYVIPTRAEGNLTQLAFAAEEGGWRSLALGTGLLSYGRFATHPLWQRHPDLPTTANSCVCEAGFLWLVFTSFCSPFALRSTPSIAIRSLSLRSAAFFVAAHFKLLTREICPTLRTTL